MLRYDDVMDAIDLRVDYLGTNASVQEHGEILESVNKYELCAEDTLTQRESWSFVHCMFGMQACLSRARRAEDRAAAAAPPRMLRRDGVAPPPRRRRVVESSSRRALARPAGTRPRQTTCRATRRKRARTTI